MAKDALWKHEKLLRGNVNLQVKKSILHCCFPVLKYSCESWTMNKDSTRRKKSSNNGVIVDYWKWKWTDKISNEEVLQCTKEDEMCFYKSIQKHKMSFTGHVLRESSGENALQILEGKLEATTAQGRPRKMWTQLNTYEDIKRLAQDRHQWRVCTEAC